MPREIPRILIIDDEQFIRDLLRDVLTRKGYRVDTAEDGLRGLEKAKTVSYSVIFTDIRMPGLNGLDVYKRLKDLCPESRVIVMTGHGLQEILDEALQLGAFADLKKPFEINHIYSLVERALESRTDRNGTPEKGP